MPTSHELKRKAKMKLQSKYGEALIACLIVFAVSSLLSACGAGISAYKNVINSYVSLSFNINPFSSVGSLVGLLITGSITVGISVYFLNLADERNPRISDLFSQFSNFTNTLVYFLLTEIFTLLWSLLFIIPGIIASISYSMTPFILAEHPEIKAKEAIKMSKEMMHGHKGEYFRLLLSFAGWYLLCILTAGIGFIFLMPYVYTCEAEFFNEISGKNYAKKLQNSTDTGFSTPDMQNGFSAPDMQNGFSTPDMQNGFSTPDMQNGFSAPYNGNTYGYSDFQVPQDENNNPHPDM